MTEALQLVIGIISVLTVMGSKVEFLDAYKRIKEADELISIFLSTAIEHEEQERQLEAIDAYEQAGKQIDEVFRIPVGLPDDPLAVEGEWLDACGIIRKLKATHETVGQRLQSLRAQNHLLIVDQEAQEATETAVAATSGVNGEGVDGEPVAKKKSVLLDNPTVAADKENAIQSYKKYANAIRELMAIENEQQDVQFDQIFQAQVKLYKIAANSGVETITGEGTLTLIMMSASETSKWHFLNGAAFMQCSLPEVPSSSANSYKLSFIYPLLPAVVTVYRTEYGAFIFPDLEAEVVDMHAAYGIMLSNELAQMSEEAFGDLQQFFLDLLEAILAGAIPQLREEGFTPTWRTLGISGEEQTRVTRDLSEKISAGIVSGADFIAHYLVRGAEKTGELMDHGTPHLMSRLQSAAPDAPPVSNSVQRTANVAKVVTGAAAGATGWVAGKIGAAAVAVGSFLAPHVEAQGTKLLERGFGYEEQEAHSKMKGAMTVAAGAVEGVTTVYGGLEKSADVLGKSLSNNSVKIISHKYGSSAGGVAADTFETVGNTWHVSRNLKIVRPKNFAESVLKKTSFGVVSDYKDKSRAKNVVAARDLQPNIIDLNKKKQ